MSETPGPAARRALPPRDEEPEPARPRRLAESPPPDAAPAPVPTSRASGAVPPRGRRPAVIAGIVVGVALLGLWALVGDIGDIAALT